MIILCVRQQVLPGEVVQEREPLASFAPHAGTEIDLDFNVLRTQLVEKVRALDEKRDRILRTPAQERTLIFAVTASHHIDEPHHLLVIHRGCELVPADAVLLYDIMEQSRDHHTVATSGDSSCDAAGVLDVRTTEPRGVTVEQPSSKPLSLFRRDHGVAPGNHHAWALGTTSAMATPTSDSSSPEGHQRTDRRSRP